MLQKLSVWVDSAWHLLNPQLLLARYMCAKSLQLCQTLCGPLNYTACQAPLSMGFSRQELSDFPFTFHFHALEKEMATHSSVLVWRIPGMVEPGGLPPMGSHRVGHEWNDLAAAAAAMPFSSGSSWPRDWTYVSYVFCFGRQALFNHGKNISFSTVLEQNPSVFL